MRLWKLGTLIALVAWGGTPALAAAAGKDAGRAGAAEEARPKFKYELELGREQRMAMADKLRDELIHQLENDIIPKFEKDNPQRPDLIFQLSEYYWEKFRFLYAQEERAYDAAYRAYEARVAQGEKGLKAPRVDHSESERYRAKTMGLYREILRDHRDFPKTDQVLFSLGSNLQDLSYAQQDDKLRAQAVKRYEELIARFPDSHLVPDTYVQLGDYYFDANDLAKATANFEKALKSDVPKVYSYALYKLAWCDFNRGEYEVGLKKLHRVVEFAEKQGQRMIDLKNEALNDLVPFYTQLDRPDDAIAYLNRKAEEPRRSKLIAKLGHQLAEAGFYSHSTGVFRKLISEDPLRPNAPEFQQAIVDNFEKLRQRQQVKAEVKKLSESYRPGSAWWKANEKDRDVLREAFAVTEGATRNIVTEYHSEAQKTQAVETFRLARDLYRQYLSAFASSEDPEFISDFAFNMMFYYAQILWGLEEWEAAAEAYDRVVAFEIPDRPEAKEVSREEYRKLAAFDAILAYDKLIKIERGELKQSRLKDGQRIRDDAAKGGMSELGRGEKREVKDAKASPLTRFETKMIAATDAYVRLDAKLRDPKDDVKIRTNAALILYDKNHFAEAEKRFADIIAHFPETEQAQNAADLTMYVLEGQERWADLMRVSLQYAQNKRLAKPGSEFARRVAQVVEGSHYKWIDEVVNKQDKKPLAAAEQFLKFVDTYPKAKAADRALTYAMLLYRDAGHLDQAIAAGERALAEYGASALEPKVRFTLAKLYEAVADFPRSAQMNEAFVAAHARRAKALPELRKRISEAKKKGNAERVERLTERKDEEEKLLEEAKPWLPDARFNAGLWWEGLGETDRAVAAFRAYLKEFPDRDDVPEIALRIATLYEKDERWGEAARAYEEFTRRYGRDKRADPAAVFRGKFRQAEVYTRLRRTRDAKRLHAELRRDWARLDAKQKEDLGTLSAYAQVRFEAMEPVWEAYQQVKLNRVRTLQRDLRLKQRRMVELEKGYVEVIALGAGDQAIGALTRIGLAYEDLAKNILESPTPPGLDEDQQAMYRAEIENLAAPIEDKALEAFQKAVEKSYELKIYGPWTLTAQEKINSYQPGAYAQVRPVEFRGAEYFATAPLARDPSGADAVVLLPRPEGAAERAEAPAEAAAPAAAERASAVEGSL